MIVQVRLFSRFRHHLPEKVRGEAAIELPDCSTVEHLLNHLSIEGRVKLITINGERVDDHGHCLREGDTVRIFPFVVGG